MEKEIIKDVVGYEGHYKVSNFGYIVSVKNGKYLRLKPGINNGYHIVVLVKNKVMDCRYVHRIVAIHFLPNPENLPFVNHKDTNRWNQRYSNLEWCTRLYNSNYIQPNGNKTGNVKRIVNNKSGEIYNSIKEAYKAVKCNKSLTTFRWMLRNGIYNYLEYYSPSMTNVKLCLPCRILKSQIISIKK